MSIDDKIKAHEDLVKSVSEKAQKSARKHGSTARITQQLTNQEAYVDTVIEPPKPSKAMFYGLAGEFAFKVCEGSEINPVASMLCYLSFLGAQVGRDVFLSINDTIHHPRLFTLHIGRSSYGGKGDSQQAVLRIQRKLRKDDENLLGQYHSGGLSTREGLAMLIHDGIGPLQPIMDKRLWVIESELANVLHQSKREGNTLSCAIRDAFDGADISPATKNNRVSASEPHIGIHANITPSELNSLLSYREMSNGFANRFLMIWAETVGNVPFPTKTPETIIDDLAKRTGEIIRFAKGNYPNASSSREMHLSQAAKDYYSSIYPLLKNPLENEFISALLVRRRVYVLRLGMLFALQEQSMIIEPTHLQAAYAWIHYSIETVRYVFKDKAFSHESIDLQANVEKIMTWLELNPNGATLTELGNACFNKRDNAGLNNALSYLLEQNPPKIIKKVISRGSKGGPKTNLYQLIKLDQVRSAKNKPGADYADYAHEAESHDIQSLQPVNDVRTNCGLWRNNSTDMSIVRNNPQLIRNDEDVSKLDVSTLSDLKAYSALSAGTLEDNQDKIPPQNARMEKYYREISEQAEREHDNKYLTEQTSDIYLKDFNKQGQMTK